MNPLYHLQDIRHGYGGDFLLMIHDMRINRGEAVGLIGPNGSGKSTLLRILAFLERPKQGSVRFLGADIKRPNTSLRQRVTLLLQEPYLLHRSVYENVAYGLKVRAVDSTSIRPRVKEALAWVGMDLESIGQRPWSALSTGEAQRVALAARLALRPEVLLMDEPTSNVDAHSAIQIQQAALTARESWGTTLVIASHDLQWLNLITDETINLFHGKVVGKGWENILFGPWERQNGKILVKRLKDGQTVRAKEPRRATGVGLLHPSKVQVLERDSQAIGEVNSLRGRICQMTLNKANEVMVHVSVGELVFVASVEPEMVEHVSLFPGKEVRISFEPSSIEWI